MVIDATSLVSVTGSGLSYNRVSKIYSGTITVTNGSSQTITGPMELSITGLSADTTLANSAGTFNGSPYLSLSTSSLAAGASVTIPVQFQTTGTGRISYAPRVYTGTLNP